MPCARTRDGCCVRGTGRRRARSRGSRAAYRRSRCPLPPPLPPSPPPKCAGVMRTRARGPGPQVCASPAVYLMDTPGVMVPRVGSVEAGLRLGLVGTRAPQLPRGRGGGGNASAGASAGAGEGATRPACHARRLPEGRRGAGHGARGFFAGDAQRAARAWICEALRAARRHDGDRRRAMRPAPRVRPE